MKELDIRIRNGGDDAIAAVSELMPRWIPVTERLPDEGVEVLWYSSHDRFARWATGKRDGGLVDWGGDLESEIEGWLTHWMPLPAPPTDGK
jgi:hypothetical protein